MKTRTVLAGTIIAFAVTLPALGVFVQQVAAETDAYRLAWFVLAGGGTSSGGNYTLQTELGEPMAGQSAGGGYTLDIGAPVQTGDGPATGTPTATRTPATPTSTPTPTKTPVPATGDRFEPDNRCDGARTVPTDGSSEEHTFAPMNDVDWVSFTAQQGVTYRIEAEPVGSSPADLVIELYRSCDEAPAGSADRELAKAARIEYLASETTTIYARFTNHDPAIAGNSVRYRITLRSLNSLARRGAFIIVAGRLSDTDKLRPNIEHITGQVYNFALANGYDKDQILFLSNMFGVDKRVDGRPTAENLRRGITQWAAERLAAGEAFTLFLMDHGERGYFYLDEPNGQRLTPAMLDGWLSQLEGARPGITVNVILEACYSGSFVSRTDGISQAGRLIITSTSADWTAYASDQGAIFSDQFWTQIHQGYSALRSFEIASTVTQGEHEMQTPWLDGNGNRVPNEPADRAVAQQRGFRQPGSFGDPWPPVITEVAAPGGVVDAAGMLQAVVVTGTAPITAAWAAIYPPSYDPSAEGDTLLPSSPYTVTLTPQEEGSTLYSGVFAQFDERGSYRIVVHTLDKDGLSALPVSFDLLVGEARLYLPVVQR